MLLADGVVNAVNSAFNDREEALDCVRVYIPSDIFPSTMSSRMVTTEIIFTDADVGFVFVGNNC